MPPAELLAVLVFLSNGWQLAHTAPIAVAVCYNRATLAIFGSVAD
jgi:hypothetical protein